MSLCREWQMVKFRPEANYARPLYCRSWRCEVCQPRRKSQLMALAASGQPTRFLTLTINPQTGTDPESRLKILSRAWRLIVKRLRRLHPNTPIDYLAIVEETKRLEPHLHILLRSPYIPQFLLSEWMRELADSPIVDIRLIRSQKEVVRYVAKYITKSPAQFGNAKRYWSSRTYELDKTNKPEKNGADGFPWLIAKVPMQRIIIEWLDRGMQTSQWMDDGIIAIPRSPPKDSARNLPCESVA